MRGIAAQPPVRPVTAGQRVEFGVDARGAEYRWRVRRVGDSAVRARGSSKEPLLTFRAPEGRLRRLPARAAVRALAHDGPVPGPGRPPRRLLVVVPTISWLGSDKVDDSPFDGIPNTLNSAGSTVRWPRAFVGTDGLPAGFAEDVAPLLVFLDRHRILYDLTSDIDLDLTRNPRATDRDGVLFIGSERWITRTLGSRLRRYVNDGGNVAMFGGDSMRRGVRLRVRESEDSGTLLRARRSPRPPTRSARASASRAPRRSRSR